MVVIGIVFERRGKIINWSKIAIDPDGVDWAVICAATTSLNLGGIGLRTGQEAKKTN